jgi:hypothetical protein
MRPDNDTVFQLSLAEIAFTLVFILLLLLGWMYIHADEQYRDTLAQLQELREHELRPYAQDAFEAAREALKSELTQAGVDADAVIERLTERAQVAAENAALRQRIDHLDAQLTALTEIKAILQQASQNPTVGTTEAALTSALELRAKLEQKILDPAGQSPAPTRQISDNDIAAEVTSALELRYQLERALQPLGITLPAGQEAAWAKTLADAQWDRSTAARENADLRGRIAFLQDRLAARGGRDYPPCWADEHTGRVQFVFNVELHPDHLTLSPAWPAARELDALTLPGIDTLLAGPHAYATFRERVQGIFQRSNTLQCRHYVQLKSRIPDAASSDRARLLVESFFYKVELTR